MATQEKIESHVGQVQIIAEEPVGQVQIAIEEPVEVADKDLDPEKINELAKEELQLKKEEELQKLLKELEELANPKCSKCYGRGYKGIANHWQPVACQCAIKAKYKKKMAEEKKVIEEKKEESPKVEVSEIELKEGNNNE